MSYFPILQVIVDHATALPAQQIVGALFGSFCLGRALGALHAMLTSGGR
jgi:hypothetical protein